MFKGLKRVVYVVSNLDAAKKWYSNLLNSEPVFDSPIAAIFKIGEHTMSLVKGEPLSSPAAASGDKERADDLKVDDVRPQITIYWEVEDVDKALARLVELGAKIEQAPGNVLTARTAKVIDPFGNTLGLTGDIPHDAERTVESKPSETAHAVAFCRALMSRDERPEMRSQDPFSELFLKNEARAVLDNERMRKTVLDTRISRPLYGFLAARTKFGDDAIKKALRSNIRQIVFLGAGYDTRALRFQSDLGSARIFELDAPMTQERKRELLRSNNVAIPPQISFVGVNFKTENLGEKLKGVGFDPAAMSLFVWEGVAYYLSKEAMENTLELVWEYSAAGSGIVFDYMTRKLDSVNAGEPFLSWMAPNDMQSYLGRVGFSVVDHLDNAEMTRRYLMLGNGSVAEKPLSAMRLVYAERVAK